MYWGEFYYWSDAEELESYYLYIIHYYGLGINGLNIDLTRRISYSNNNIDFICGLDFF